MYANDAPADDSTDPGILRVVRLAARALSVPSAALWLQGPGGLHVAHSHGLAAGAEPTIDPVRSDAPRVILIEDLSVTPTSSIVGAADVSAPWARACGLARIERGGVCYGVLGAFDPRPRVWSPRDADVLLDCATLAAELLERPRADESLRAVLDRVPGAVIVCDRDARVTLAAGADMRRHGLVDLTGKKLSDGLEAQTYALYDQLVRDALAGTTGSCEIGSDEGAYEVHASPLRRAEGSVLGVLIMIHDVTARLAACAAQRASDARHGMLFAKAGEAIYIVQADGANAGAILDANAAAAEMYGYTVEELLRMTESDLKAPEEREATCRRIHRIGGVNWVESDATHVRKDGTRFPVSFSAGPLDVGADRFVLIFARDVTERQRTEQALRDATRAADAASRAKSAFLANMSHEIRTPLNAILGYAQLLARDSLVPEQRQHLGVIAQSGEQLLALTNDVLALSKLEVGHGNRTREEVDLVTLLEELEQSFRLRAAQKHLSFTMKRAPQLPQCIVGDGSKIRQILMNLLGNAVKFTSRGGVRVFAAFQASAGGGEGRLTIDVEDTGPGISREVMATMFQPFVQVRVGIVAQGGTGLGLAVSREFARALGGDVTLESEVGKGSRFRFEVPAIARGPCLPTRRSAAGPIVAVSGQAGVIRILITDDDERDRYWMRALLERVGFDVREAATGLEAEAAMDVYRPHLALVVTHAAGRNGGSALRAVRRRRAGRKCAIVALVPASMGDGRDSATDAAADGWLRKPFTETELLNEIQRRLGVEYRYADATSTPHGSIVPDPADLRQLPLDALDPRLRGELLAALRVADYEGLLAAVDRISPDQPETASALRALVEGYAYQAIEDLLQEAS